MKISEIKPNQGKIEVTGTVSGKSEPRTFNKFGSEGRVCNAKLTDESGSIKLTLWNDQVDNVNDGQSITIKNGYASEYQGETQLSTGKFGTLEVSGEGSPAPKKEKKEAKKEKKSEDKESEKEFENADEESFEDF
jgi:replication factor A1